MLNKVSCLASAMECAELVIRSYLLECPYGNKIVFTSPEARVECSGEKIKPRCWSKPFEHIQIYIRLKGQL